MMPLDPSRAPHGPGGPPDDAGFILGPLADPPAALGDPGDFAIGASTPGRLGLLEDFARTLFLEAGPGGDCVLGILLGLVAGSRVRELEAMAGYAFFDGAWRPSLKVDLVRTRLEDGRTLQQAWRPDSRSEAGGMVRRVAKADWVYGHESWLSGRQPLRSNPPTRGVEHLEGGSSKEVGDGR